MGFIALAVLVLTGRPILARDQHLGRDGQAFARLRFRTLRYGRGPELSRLTPLGARLRVRGFDQLPQLWNVLRGDMSLMGPRPVPSDALAHCDEFQMMRFAVKPGLLGPTHLHQSDSLAPEQELTLEAEYTAHRSIRGDLALARRWLALLVLRRAGWPAASDGMSAESAGPDDSRTGRAPQPGERSGAG